MTGPADRMRALRARRAEADGRPPGRPGRPPKPPTHGTAAGYRWHLRNDHPTCGPCRDAWNTYQRQRRTRPEEATDE